MIRLSCFTKILCHAINLFSTKMALRCWNRYKIVPQKISAVSQKQPQNKVKITETIVQPQYHTLMHDKLKSFLHSIEYHYQAVNAVWRFSYKSNENSVKLRNSFQPNIHNQGHQALII